jgi:invasion protein IalB
MTATGKCAVAALAATLAFSGPLPAMAQNVGQQFGDWVVECTALGANRTVCSLTQTLISQQTRQQVAKFTLGRNVQSNQVTLIAVVPLGIDLTQPLTGSVDNNPAFTYTIETCVAAGCVATKTVDPALMLSLKNGGKLNLNLRMRGAQQPSQLVGSLSGITAGVSAIGLE